MYSKCHCLFQGKRRVPSFSAAANTDPCCSHLLSLGIFLKFNNNPFKLDFLLNMNSIVIDVPVIKWITYKVKRTNLLCCFFFQKKKAWSIFNIYLFGCKNIKLLFLISTFFKICFKLTSLVWEVKNINYLNKSFMN